MEQTYQNTCPVVSGPPTCMVVIGSGVGGPQALAAVLGDLPAEFPGCLLVVPNMGKGFTHYLAQKLGFQCKLPVKIAADGQLIRAGTVILVPSESNVRIDKCNYESDATTLQVTDHDNISRREQFDNLLTDVTNVYKKNTMAVFLTSTQKSGLVGAEAVKNAGGKLVAQDEASSVCHDFAAQIVDANPTVKAVPLWTISNMISTFAINGLTQAFD